MNKSKKKFTRILCFYIFICLISGCAPLSQAPLVYTSRSTIGVHISMTNPETPGAELDVGWKGKDMAIVPVAVAKLPKMWGGDAGSPQITVVRASSSASVNPESLSQAIKERDDAAKELENINLQLSEVKNNTNLIQKYSQRIEILQNEINSMQTQFQDIAGDLSNQRKLKEDEVNELQSKINNLKNQPSIEGLETSLLEKQAKFDEKSKKLQEVEGKSDAYSVFGSFNSVSDIKGNELGGGVTLGKTFATGVAAQNISVGIIRASCIDSLAKAKYAIKEINELCGKK